MFPFSPSHHTCTPPKNFNRKTVWMQEEVRRIGRTRFESAYWPSLDQAIVNSVHQHSLVICDPNKDNALAGFVLVCPPPDRRKAAQWGLSPRIDYDNMYEIAFVAVDAAWEGRGLARQLLTRVLAGLDAAEAGGWLHVDLINPRAMRLYESLGFLLFDALPDPYGSMGYLMIYLERRTKLCGDSHIEKWATLFHSGPGETKEALRRSVFAPPGVTSGGHAFPCLV
jgi:ribosomal protein S18 acetylase RimI-like enzyme